MCKKMTFLFASILMSICFLNKVDAGEVGTGELAGSDTNNAPLQIQMDMTVAPSIQGILYSNLAQRGSPPFGGPSQSIILIHSITGTATGTLSSGAVDYRVRDNGANAAYYGIKYSTAVRSSGMSQANLVQSAAPILSFQVSTYDAKQSDVQPYVYNSGGATVVSNASGITPVSLPFQQLSVSSNETHCGADYAQVNQNFCYSGSNINADMDRALFGKIDASDTPFDFKSAGLVITWAAQ
ncbi:MAG: hypothetical protein JNK65_01365 [Deltaproteobacteria bacterium]|nr:hypothetical protein [Deltaproteobacteria bacterium]